MVKTNVRTDENVMEPMVIICQWKAFKNSLLRTLRIIVFLVGYTGQMLPYNTRKYYLNSILLQDSNHKRQI